MNKVLLKTLKQSSGVLGAALLLTNAALATEASSKKLANVTAQASEFQVPQMRDVQPTDWAFQTLLSFIQRYACATSFTDNRPLTRYEFAARLKDCLVQVNTLIAASEPNLVSPEDLAALQRLQKEFAAELATLGFE